MTFFNALATLWPNSKYVSTAATSRLSIFLALIFYVFVNYSSVSFAQSRKDSGAGAQVQGIQALQIGDQVPEEFWNHEHLYASDGQMVRSTLDVYRGKLLIIDFWASWCTPCLSAFPTMDSLSAQFNQAEFIKVTYEQSSVKAAGSSIVQDTILSQYFQHRIIPHYVWISPTGQVLDFTFKDALSARHIQRMLAGDGSSTLSKVDLDFAKPIFLSLPDSVRVPDIYSTFHIGLYKGLPSGFHYREGTGRTVGMAMMNQPLKTIYRKLARQLLLGLDSSYLHHPFIVELNEPRSKDFDAPQSRDNVLYTYDIEVSRNKAPELHQIILDDINRHTAYHGSIQQREMPVILLRKSKNAGTKAKEHAEIDDPVRFKDGTTSSLVGYLNAGAKLGRFIIDQTGGAEISPVPISRSANTQQIKATLADHGLELIESATQLTVFVVRDDSDVTSTPVSHSKFH